MSVENGETGADTATPPAKKESVFHRLYVGTGAFDIVGHRKRFYAFFAALLIVCIASIGIKGFNLGIEFEGGTQIQMPAVGTSGPISENQAKEAFGRAVGMGAEEAQRVGVGAASTLQIRSQALDPAQVAKAKQGLFRDLQPVNATGQPSEQTISDSAVSASWGGEISRQAVIALLVFLVLVTAFLAIYFEPWMAVSALLALLHDVVITAGLYALVGFEVSPATVIGLLTILGFSLYDTVVVFDKVTENTRGLLGRTRRTYAETANLALNQTLMRSINTSVIALLPVLGLLVIGYLLLGPGVLLDLALVQMIGMIAGLLSSVCLATPLLVDFKMRDPKYQQQAERVSARRAKAESKVADPDASDVDENAEEPRASEQRKDKAYAGAATSTPRRVPKSTARKSKPSSKPTGKRRR